MEVADGIFVGRQRLLRNYLAAADNLHAAAAGSQEAQQRLRHPLGGLTEGDGLVVVGQVVRLYHHQSVVCQQVALAGTVLVAGCETESRRQDFIVEDVVYTAVFQPMGLHEVVRLTNVAHLLLLVAIGNHACHFLQCHAVNGFLLVL